MSFRSASRSLTALAFPAALALAACSGGEGGDAMARDAGSDGSLGEPTAVFPEDFGAIQTVRELDDRTVLVADPLGGALYRVDLDAGTRTQVGAEGQGPEEYQQPDAVWPLPGDSTLLVDLGNGRMVGLGPDLSFGPTSPLSAGDPRSGLILAIPTAVDDDGFVYAEASMGGGPGGQLPDSGAVLRIDRATMVPDTITRVKLTERIRTESGSGNNRSVNIAQVPLSLEDTWGAAPDGSIVVARSSDYHLEWHRPDGSVVVGSPVGHDPMPLGNAEKQAWIDAQGRTGGGLMIGVTVNNGAMQMSFGRGRGGMGGGSQEQTIDDYTWPEMAPPFFGDPIRVDPEGRAWVRRFVEAGEDAMYDVFDAQGGHLTTYTLEGDRRVVGFGEEAVYVVTFDEFDLNYLERYALPG